MEVYLIRHTTPAVTKGMIYGHTDVPLSDSFNDEKKIVLSRLPLPVDAVYSSPSVRCTSLATQMAHEVIIDQRLREINFGLWEGKTWDSISPEELDPWMADFVNCCPPGGESMVQMSRRVIGFWNELRCKSYSTVALVTHAGVIRLIMTATGGKPLQSAFDIKVDYGEVFLVSC